MLELSIKNLKASIRKMVQQTAADTFKTNVKIKVSSKETEEIKNEMENMINETFYINSQVGPNSRMEIIEERISEHKDR